MIQQEGTHTRQRLAAILAADAVGYSRLMAGDEQRTMAALDAARKVFREQIESHHGRVIDMAGDSVLAVFDTATGAVSASLDVQLQLEGLAAGVPADRQMRFRIGVHMGDVFEKPDGTVYGDGVNIAARLEGLALPGGVTVSDAVQGAVRHRVAAQFEDLGEQQVKNIADPVRAYRVLAATNGGAPARRRWPASIMPLTAARRRGLIGAAFALGGLSLGAAAWLMTGTENGGGVAPTTMSLAVGSIAAPANDAATAQAADALAQNLSTGLGAVERTVRVVSVARGASAAATLRELARAAGARYVVEGDLQTASPGRWLNLCLIETASGTLAWSGRFDLPEATGSVDAAAARKWVRQLAFNVESAEISRVLAKPVRQLDAMELVVRAWAVLDQGQSVAIANEARKLLDESLRIDPTLVPALVAVVWQLDMLNDTDPHPDHERYVRESDEYSSRAVTLEADNPRAWDARALALMLLGRWNASLEASDRQIKLDPYAISPYLSRAWLLNMMGRPAEALPLTDKALALDPYNTRTTLRFECEAHLLLGEADKAIATCERASGLTPNDFIPHSFLAAAYANAGDIVQAQAALRMMLKILPGYTIAQLRAKRYSDHPEYQKLAEKYWYEGLRKAGLADQ